MPQMHLRCQLPATNYARRKLQQGPAGGTGIAANNALVFFAGLPPWHGPKCNVQ
jgi:hypothetical protein